MADAWFSQATLWLIGHDWGIVGLDDELQFDVDAVEKGVHSIRQAAFDGRITVWGKGAPAREMDESAVLEPILVAHWRDHDVDWFSLLKGGAAAISAHRARTGAHRVGYRELKVSRAQVMVAFPRKQGSLTSVA